MGRQPNEIKEEEILRAVDECDKNNDGLITKEEMNEWVVQYMSQNNDSSIEMSKVYKKSQSLEKETN
jgi:Ca2+-binding EF-hand superfamily protein